MSKQFKFTKAALEKLKHPIGDREERWYDLACEGLACYVQPQPSLKNHYMHVGVPLVMARMVSKEEQGDLDISVGLVKDR